MLYIYINYPGSRFVAHNRATCGFLAPQKKPNQRRLTITAANVETELQNFREIRYKFNSTLGKLDMWIDIELGSYDKEVAVATQIGHCLAEHYKQFRDIQLSVHCFSLEEWRRQAEQTTHE